MGGSVVTLIEAQREPRKLMPAGFPATRLYSKPKSQRVSSSMMVGKYLRT